MTKRRRGGSADERAGHEPASTAPGTEPAGDARGADLVHELRTPLAGIAGLADLLADTALSLEQRNYVRMIQASSRAMLTMVEALLTRGTAADEPGGGAHSVFDPAALLEETVELVALQAHARGLELATVVMPDVPERVTGDAAGLRQILLNLLVNAMKFTEAGGAVARLGIGPPGHLRFEIRDTGIGLPDVERARIFGRGVRGPAQESVERFGQSQGSTPGHGLGLAIVARLVATLGGSIEAMSHVNGARFVVDLPLPATDPPRAPVISAGLSVLLVTASPLLRDALTEQLCALGVATDAPTVAEAEAAAGGGHDVLLLDGALEQAALDRLLHVFRRNARSIVLIAPDQRGRLPALRDAGCDTYLVKPVRLRSLASRLDGRPVQEAKGPAFLPCGPGGRERLRILIVEDDEVNALLLTAILARWGHAPTRAANGAAALTHARAMIRAGRPPDVLLTDLRLPDMGGLAVTIAIRAFLPNLPAVAMSASPAMMPATELAIAGIAAVLAKPVDRGHLAEALRRAVQQAGAA